MPANEPTIASILQNLAAQFDGPVAERLLLERVLEQRPSTAKNPYATIRERLRWDGPALGWLRLDRNELVPVRVVLQGLRFRYIPSTWEVNAGLLPLMRLQPFVGLRDTVPHLQDTTGRSLSVCDTHTDAHSLSPNAATTTSFDLGSWYTRVRFEPGDSIVLTILATDPLTLQLTHEAAPCFRVSDVAAQDSELLEAIVERTRRSRLPLTPCDELVLPVFARAAWRTSYPGHPWQQLVARDGRVQLVNGIFLTDQKTGLDLPYGSADSYTDDARTFTSMHAHDEEVALAEDIEQLQQELSASRQQDADTGLWSGQLQRASTNQIYGIRAGRLSRLHLDRLDPFHEEYGEPGMFDGDDWDEEEWEDAWEESDLFEALEDDELDDFAGDDVDLFEASQRLVAALPPETLEQLQTATPEEAEVLIARHLNELLVREPSLFMKIDLSPTGTQFDEGSDHHNDWAVEPVWNDEPEHWDSEWDDDLDTNLDVQIPSVYTRSSELMSQFYDYLIATGKSDSTARSRTRDLWVYAEFLAYYYDRTLAEGDYATLDECLFFFYPRKVLNSTPRQVREMCISLKQFYAFLTERGDIADDRFAQALWRRRNQAARVIELYERLSHDMPGFEQLFVRLFAPYLH